MMNADGTVRFRFLSELRGVSDFEVLSGQGRRRISVRDRTGWTRQDYPGGSDEYAREIVGSMGLAWRRDGSGEALEDDVVRAFNAWRAAEHAGAMAEIAAHPEKYGEASDATLTQEPIRVHGGRRDPILGWVSESRRRELMESFIAPRMTGCPFEAIAGERFLVGRVGKTGVFLVDHGGPVANLGRWEFREIAGEARRRGLDPEFMIAARTSTYMGPNITFMQVGA